MKGVIAGLCTARRRMHTQGVGFPVILEDSKRLHRRGLKGERLGARADVRKASDERQQTLPA